MNTAAESDIAWQRLCAAVARLADVTRDRTWQGTTHHQADGIIGTADTDDAIGFDPIPLLQALHRHGARVVIIGQVAGIMHGSVELTGDLDLLWDGTPEQAAAMAVAFAEFSTDLTDNDDKPVACTPEGFAQAKLAFRTPVGCGDCCTPALNWRGLPVTDYLVRALTAIGPDETVVRYLRRDDLITMRRTLGRPKDLRRAIELEQLADDTQP